ncbi:hypothetical protein GGS20DRAFT_584328 [Poronia punctata]|nr:hypothetical protein GGS20DRAFT_584328 [Poronia punctata]
MKCLAFLVLVVATVTFAAPATNNNVIAGDKIDYPDYDPETKEKGELHDLEGWDGTESKARGLSVRLDYNVNEQTRIGQNFP